MGVILANLEIFLPKKRLCVSFGPKIIVTQQHKQMVCFVAWVGCHIKGHAIDHEYVKTLIMLECTKITEGN
jgi:hypothetical protein